MATENTDVSAAARRLILLNVCLGQFVVALDSRSVNVALPTLATEFGSAMQTVQWVPLSYQLTVIGLVLSLGRLGDMLGRKTIYNLGFLIFMGATVLCGFSTGLATLVSARVLEGIGGAMILANGRAIVSTVFAGSGRGRALGMTSTAFHLGYVVGPSIAGYLIDALGWRSIFFVSVPVALIGAAMAWRVLQESRASKRVYSIDIFGSATLLAFVVALVLGLNRAARSGFDLGTDALFGLFAVLLGLFIVLERRTDEPVLDLGLFRKKLFSAGIATLALVSLSQTGVFFLLPFYLQGILSLTPTQVGLTLIFYSIVIVFLAPLGGSFSDRFGSRRLCTIGSAVTAASVFSLSFVGADSTRVAVIIPLMGMGLGWSLFASPNLSSLFGSVGQDRLGAVGGATVTAANVANAVAIALASMLFATWLQLGGVDHASATGHGEWLQAPEPYLIAFRNCWVIFAGAALAATVISAVGVGEKSSERSGNA